MQMEPLSAARSASASSTVATMMIRDAPFARATAAVVKARKVSITATAPLAFLAPSKRLWIEIFIAAAASGLFDRSVRARLARAFGDIPKQDKPMIIVDGQIHLWEKGTPSAHHQREAGRARTRRALCPRRQRTKGRKSHPRHRAAGRGRD